MSVFSEDLLRMPEDFLNVDQWIGETWDPENKKKETMTFLHYLNSPEHLKRTAVLYSGAGTGKTPAMRATAKEFAIMYQHEEQPYFLQSGTAHGFGTAFQKGLLKRGVPRVVEDFVPRGNPTAKRQSREEFLINLLDVEGGGTIDSPGGRQVSFPRGTPQLIGTNRPFDQWIGSFDKLSAQLKDAVWKRIVFFEVPDQMVNPELRKRRAENMEELVREGFQQKQKFCRRHCIPASVVATEVSTSIGSSSPSRGSTTDGLDMDLDDLVDQAEAASDA